ncbi:hypothetical protein PPERSA_02073 [Pseudocohnilembus persalinus]|uniref:1-alkyl-2-acetylglycerophosphocholine esterase n=1 Tax=Pseudocohnilembus persalinus TaxID=266149 RepID=A0A0V0Q7S5_PSEPJ|nr:hypothetical protein PPERSA_02073 [Pseudocohnilembus persalinus]|eukprot:KRW98296.1 hypothetical protein PPERSA_02073 [Pseudocohnilembus persalinus]
MHWEQLKMLNQSFKRMKKRLLKSPYFLTVYLCIDMPIVLILNNLDNKGYLTKLFDINDNLKKNVKFETDNICLLGHSFGGGTAIYTAMNENRIKSVVVLDPWLFPINKQDLQDLPIKQPILIINSENFYTLCLKMDQKQKMDQFIQTQKNKKTLDNKQMIMLKGTGHTNQCDMIFPTSVQSKIAMKYQVGDLNLILQFHRLQLKCMEIFLQENNQCITQTSKDDRIIKLNIKKQIDDYFKQNKMDQFLLYEIE